MGFVCQQAITGALVCQCVHKDHVDPDSCARLFANDLSASFSDYVPCNIVGLNPGPDAEQRSRD
jgi:hypothetical protein